LTEKKRIKKVQIKAARLNPEIGLPQTQSDDNLPKIKAVLLHNISSSSTTTNVSPSKPTQSEKSLESYECFPNDGKRIKSLPCGSSLKFIDTAHQIDLSNEAPLTEKQFTVDLPKKLTTVSLNMNALEQA
jgi:hypothetical protein